MLRFDFISGRGFVMMTLDMESKLRRSLILHEGMKNFPYVDTEGKITIGIGYNLTDRGVGDEWINSQFLTDINYFYAKLSDFSWFENLNEDRQTVLIDMCFMGFKNFLEFKEMIDALEQHNYVKAAQEMLDSKWAQEVKGRAIVLANGMEHGIYII